MPSIGIWELGIIFLIIIVLFGSSRIPELARSLGSGIKEFKKSVRNDEDPTAGPRKIEGGNRPGPDGN